MYHLQCLHALPEQTTCGQQIIQPNIKNLRIINGLEAVEDSWPWIVSIRQIKNNQIQSHTCGGVLIYEDLVLTAAHCVGFLDANEIAVIAGIHNINNPPSSLNTYHVSARYFHDGFDSELLENDIAILILSRNVTLSKEVGLVCLSNNSSVVYNETLVTVGWGRYEANSELSPTLKQGTLKIINGKSECFISNLKHQYNPDKQFCALDESLMNRQSACIGDSGGPLLYRTDSRWSVFGITSYVIRDSKTDSCDNTRPSYFTQVPEYLEWIEYGINYTLTGRVQAKSFSFRVVANTGLLSCCKYLFLITVCVSSLFIVL